MICLVLTAQVLLWNVAFYRIPRSRKWLIHIKLSSWAMRLLLLSVFISFTARHHRKTYWKIVTFLHKALNVSLIFILFFWFIISNIVNKILRIDLSPESYFWLSAWTVEDDTCHADRFRPSSPYKRVKTDIVEQIHQTSKASAFNGFRQYMIRQKCETTGNNP